MNGFSIIYKKREKRYSGGQTNSPFTHIYCLLLFNSNKRTLRVIPTATSTSTRIFLCSEQYKRFFFRNKKQNKNHFPPVCNYESLPAVFFFARLLHYPISNCAHHEFKYLCENTENEICSLRGLGRK